MKTSFTARHIRLHPRLREIVQTKLAKLERVLPGRAEARVVVTAGRQDVEVEVTVAGRHGTLTATARAADQQSAAQDVMDRVAAQAVKTKTKVKGVKKRAASAVRSPAAWPAEQPADRPRPSGPRRETFSPRAMFEEDALTAFAASRREVLVFRDPASHHALRFLYRRRDGTLGLVVPE
ncbi:MAG TPA: ribosome-associated translation inhibitor RaiA [Thermoanaerobaculia bacterium]|nr:ribosome-associated translation inhibitor RaiA [Thermoanaerobaculia bacterium]